MIKVCEGLNKGWIELFFQEINNTSMKRDDFASFKKAYESRDVIISIWENELLIAFGSMLTDWTMNSIIYDVVVKKQFERKGFGKKNNG